ncbi:MAG: hypothetical protein Q4B26_05695 [Eubacteriales bacterium]|nr:hypothetical protein [Eubacteriales bacterium]
MFGIIYFILTIALGWQIVRFVVGTTHKKETMLMWIYIPAAYGIGTLFMTWGVYFCGWISHVMFRSDKPLFWANLLVMAGVALYLCKCFMTQRKEGFRDLQKMLSQGTRKQWIREGVFYGLIFLFVLVTMVWVFQEKNGFLYSGATVYGDYAPHTAMMRSFSYGTNFPTQYPHFGGQDVKYHFMFQFLVGNLEYLGMRLDIAYNLESTAALTGFLMLLCQIVRRVNRHFAAQFFAVFFFFFRSGTAFYRYLWEHYQAGDLVQTLKENIVFIGYTPNENWGLWNYNVYLNQRHLAFGLLLAAFAIWIYMDWVDAGAFRKEKGLVWVKNRLFSLEGWKSRDLSKAIFTGLFLGLCAFWNGAALIGCLLILAGFAVFSDGKLDYLVTAVCAILFSVLQTKIFIFGSSVSPSIYWGFISEDKSIQGVLYYLFQISGLFVFGLLVCMIFYWRRNRELLFGFILPICFAFVGSLTPDVNVNHKYIMISWAFLAVFWGDIMSRIFRGKWWKKALAVLLSVALSLTGMYEFTLIMRNNDKNHRVVVDLNSDLTHWLKTNLTSDDVILTPEYSMCDVTMSGVMMYLGWPYYAWSAGYDTYGRAAVAIEMYTTKDVERLKELARTEGIRYILFEEGMNIEGNMGIEDTIKEAFTLVYTGEEGRRVRIYET